MIVRLQGSTDGSTQREDRQYVWVVYNREQGINSRHWVVRYDLLERPSGNGAARVATYNGVMQLGDTVGRRLFFDEKSMTKYVKHLIEKQIKRLDEATTRLRVSLTADNPVYVQVVDTKRPEVEL